MPHIKNYRLCSASLALLVASLCLGQSFSGVAYGEIALLKRHYVKVSGGTAKSSLKRIAKTFDVGLVSDPVVTRSVKTQSINGEFNVFEAFEEVLKGTPLEAVPVSGGKAFAVKQRLNGGETNLTESQKQSTTNKHNPHMNEKVSDEKKHIRYLIAALASAATVGSTPLVAQDDDNEDEIFELSPFSVSAESTEGYRATTTLAGTRLNTQLRDLGTAIQVLTDEMFEDTGATDAETILSYSISAEVGGEQGNFSGASDVGTSHSDTTEGRVNPQSNQRIRGLEPATLTRNYFETDIAFDAYNIEAVTINRGPNSLLFGIGNSGGVIENTTKRAFFGNDFNEVSFRFGSHSSYRGTFDINKELIEGRLAARIAGLKEKKNFRQDPAFEEDERIYLALEGVLAKNENSEFLDQTSLRFNTEHGSIVSNPVNVLPPADSISHWFEAPDSVTQYTGIEDPEWLQAGGFTPKTVPDNRAPFGGSDGAGAPLTSLITWQFALFYNDPNGTAPFIGEGFEGVQGVQSRIPFRGQTPETSPGGNRDTWVTTNYYNRSQAPGFRMPVIQNRNVWDNVNHLLTGNTGFVERDFSASSLNFEQTFWNHRAGIELAFDQQKVDVENSLPFGNNGAGGGTRGMDVGVDVTQYLANPNGADGFWVANPNLGRPVIRDPFIDTKYNTREHKTKRATAFYIQDFTQSDNWSKWLGKHTVTGFYNDTQLDVTSHTDRMVWTPDGSSFDTAHVLNVGSIASPNTLAWRSNAFVPIYLGPSLLGDEYQSLADVRLQQINVTLPTPGTQYDVHYFDRRTNTVETGTAQSISRVAAMNRTQRTIITEAVALQSSLFNGNLVGLLGWRSDEQRTTGRASTAELPDETDRLSDRSFDLTDNFLSATEDPREKEDTFTWSLVGHLPWELPGGVRVSAHYNNSENFNPVGNRVDVYNQTIDAPKGKTVDYGLSFEVLDGKFVARLNWFETESQNLRASLNAQEALNFVTNVLINDFNPQEISVDVPDPDNPGGFLANPTEVQMWNYWIGQTPAAVEKGMLDRWSNFQEYRQSLFELIPAEIQAARGYVFDSETGILEAEGDGYDGRVEATREAVAKGVELELVGKITDSWRVAFNVSKQETVTSNIGPNVDRLVSYWVDTLEPLGVMDMDWGIDFGGGGPARGRFNTVAVNPLIAQRALEGTVSPEQRKYRANLITNYNFKEGKFKGFGIGGALRWQSKNAIGFAVEPLPGTEGQGLIRPLIDQPIEGKALTTGDFWASYDKRIFNDSVDWKIQLNVRNAIADRDYRAVRANPDGSIAVVRNPPPLDIFITNTFKF